MKAIKEVVTFVLPIIPAYLVLCFLDLTLFPFGSIEHRGIFLVLCGISYWLFGKLR